MGGLFRYKSSHGGDGGFLCCPGLYILPYTTPLGGGNRKNNIQKEGKEKTENLRTFNANYHIHTKITQSQGKLCLKVIF